MKVSPLPRRVGADARRDAMRPLRRRRRNRTARRNGFTLIESALATVIVGVGVLAIVEAQQSFMTANAWSSQSATGTYLANEIREMMEPLSRHDPVTGIYIGDEGDLEGWGPDAGEWSVEDFDDVDDFDGITFAFDGTADIIDGDLPGPIDAFGAVIPEILADGTVVIGEDDEPMAMQGWTQEVRVTKVHPFNAWRTFAPEAELDAETPILTGLAVDEFPLRVTVTVRYQGPFDAEPMEITSVSWIVP